MTGGAGALRDNLMLKIRVAGNAQKFFGPKFFGPYGQIESRF